MSKSAISHSEQLSLELELSPAEQWDLDAAHRAIDELFSVANQYRSSSSYFELMQFAARFRAFAPFNAMLLHIQMPGAVFVTSPSRWLRDYGRRIKLGARPLVILQTMGPVKFVFDVSDTEPLDGAPELPWGVERPFEVSIGVPDQKLFQTRENALRDGIRIVEQKAGSQSAGSIEQVDPGQIVHFQVRVRPKPEYVTVPLRYHISLNSDHSSATQYVSLVHELAHLYCGHLGTPDTRWWPDRRKLSEEIREFEAESVSYLVCSRFGIVPPSAEYLAHYCTKYDQTPPISLECVVKAAGLIEQMGNDRLPPRKENKST